MVGKYSPTRFRCNRFWKKSAEFPCRAPSIAAHARSTKLRCHAEVDQFHRILIGMFIQQQHGGIALHQGKIAEMRTGEGKTLVAVAPVTGSRLWMSLSVPPSR